MNVAADDQERRAREIADITRRYLIGLNTGGVALTFAVIGSLAERGVKPGWAVWPTGIFVFGLVISGVSLTLAKHRTLKRRDAAESGDPKPDFKKWYCASFSYEILTLAVFVLAVVVGLCKLHGMHV